MEMVTINFHLGGGSVAAPQVTHRKFDKLTICGIMYLQLNNQRHYQWSHDPRAEGQNTLQKLNCKM